MRFLPPLPPQLRHAADITLGAGTASTPLWLPYVDAASKVGTMIGIWVGVALTILRLGMAVQEWRVARYQRVSRRRAGDRKPQPEQAGES